MYLHSLSLHVALPILFVHLHTDGAHDTLSRRAWLRLLRRVLRRRGGFHRRFCNSRGLRRLTFILHVGFSSERFRYFLGGGTCGWLGRRRRFLRDGFGGLALQRIRQLLDQTAFGRRRFLRRS